MAEVAGLLQVGLQRLDLPLQHRRLHQPGQQAAQVGVVDRLDEIVRRAQAQRLHAGVDAGVARAQHDLRIGRDDRVGHQLHAAAVGQLQVQHQDVGLLQRDLAPRLGNRLRGGDAQALAGDQVAQRTRGLDVVVNDEGMWHGSADV